MEIFSEKSKFFFTVSEVQYSYNTPRYPSIHFSITLNLFRKQFASPVMSAPGFRHGLSSKLSKLYSWPGTPFINPTLSKSSAANLPPLCCKKKIFINTRKSSTINIRRSSKKKVAATEKLVKHSKLKQMDVYKLQMNYDGKIMTVYYTTPHSILIYPKEVFPKSGPSFSKLIYISQVLYIRNNNFHESTGAPIAKIINFQWFFISDFQLFPKHSCISGT